MNEFTQISISGTAYERGIQHGEQLKQSIGKTIEFYRSIFEISEMDILQHAAYFQQLIRAFNAEYIDEINGIAEGADIDPLWIVALNARTEILSHKNAYTSNECTAVYFPKPSILGQNWDWGCALEPLTVLMKITKPDGHMIRMMTEPGIIGKIGMNSCGLGVCLNILTFGKILDGLPVHIILRAILDCQSLDEARLLLKNHASGKASNVIVAQSGGGGFDTEFCGDELFFVEPALDYQLHTNHYLGKAVNSAQNPDFFSSYARFERATQLLESTRERSVTSMCELLSDDSDSELPIYRDYVADAFVHELGTVFSIVMSLAEQKMLVRKGKGAGAHFIEYGFD